MYNYFNPVPDSDRYGLKHNDELKVEALCQKLKFPVEDILKAVQEVGFDEEEVEEYIRDRYNRS